MTAETRKRRKYTDEFKRDAVLLVTEQGYTLAEAARSLGINSNLLGRWKHTFEEAASGSHLGTPPFPSCCAAGIWPSPVDARTKSRRILIVTLLVGPTYAAIDRVRARSSAIPAS